MRLCSIMKDCVQSQKIMLNHERLCLIIGDYADKSMNVHEKEWAMRQKSTGVKRFANKCLGASRDYGASRSQGKKIVWKSIKVDLCK